jgi:hypothetical protein
MPTTMLRYKAVCYAYPTSTSAERHGFSKDGCWLVEVDGGPTRAYATKEEAIEAASEIDLPWSKFSAHTSRLYWAFSTDHGCLVVWANHPKAGKIFMGTTMEAAREVAKTCDWCSTL